MGTEVVLQAMRESGYTPTAIGIVDKCAMCCSRDADISYAFFCPYLL
jgi:hypothetical protein